MPQVLSDGEFVGASGAVSIIETSLLAFLKNNKTLPSLFLRFAIVGDGFTGVSTQTLKIIFNDDETFSIDGYKDNIGISFLQGSVSLAIGGAIALTGGTVGIVGAIGISAVTSTIFSVMGEALPDWYVGQSFTDILKFYDQSGNYVSTMYYPYGMDGSEQQNEHAILDFIGRAQTEITNGGTIKIETSYFDTQLDASYSNLT